MRVIAGGPHLHHQSPIGCAEQVADFIEAWFNETDCDEFNMHVHAVLRNHTFPS